MWLDSGHDCGAGFARSYAAALNAATPVFNWLNARAPHIAGRFLRGSLGARFDRAVAKVLKALDSIDDEELVTAGMFYPNKWDPSVGEYVTLADLISSISAHLRHHLAEIS